MSATGTSTRGTQADANDCWRAYRREEGPWFLVKAATVDLPETQIATLADSVLSAINSTRNASDVRRALQRSEALVNGVEEMAEIGLWQLDLSSSTIKWSDMTYRIHGMDPDAFKPDYENALEFYPEEVRGLVRSSVTDALRTGSGFSFVLPFRRADGELRTIRSVGQVIRDPDGDRLFGIFQDITEMKEAELRLWWTANHDALTGLPNRMLFQDRLDAALAVARSQSRAVGLIIVDLDHFKSINDVYGHEAGDELLRAVARRLNASMRQGDTLARLGGDEFAIIVNDLLTPEDLNRPLSRLREAADIDFVYRGTPIPVKLSMGAAIFPRDAADERELYRNADIALFRTKAERAERSTIYTAAIGAEQDDRETQLRRIREAIAIGAIHPFYQPVYDLQTGTIASIEVLARWREGEKLMSASALSEAFEDAELAPQIGHRVLETVVDEWFAMAPELRVGLPISINLSLSELRNLAFVEDLRKFVAHGREVGCEVILEMSQNPVPHLPSQVNESMRGLISGGACFGFASLAAGFEVLVEEPEMLVRQIKAHRSTLTDQTDRARSAIIGGMLDTCRQLGVQLIATEIETDDDLARLREVGYTLGQGFLFCKAMNFEDLSRLLRRHHKSTTERAFPMQSSLS
ncbi:MAG: diguanylate cyclase [Pseudomonadota bacterium]